MPTPTFRPGPAFLGCLLLTLLFCLLFGGLHACHVLPVAPVEPEPVEAVNYDPQAPD